MVGFSLHLHLHHLTMVRSRGLAAPRWSCLLWRGCTPSDRSMGSGKQEFYFLPSSDGQSDWNWISLGLQIVAKRWQWEGWVWHTHPSSLSPIYHIPRPFQAGTEVPERFLRQRFLSDLPPLGTSTVVPQSGKSGAASPACWERLCLAGAAQPLLCLLQSLSSLLLLGSRNPGVVWVGKALTAHPVPPFTSLLSPALGVSLPCSALTPRTAPKATAGSCAEPSQGLFLFCGFLDLGAPSYNTSRACENAPGC